MCRGSEAVAVVQEPVGPPPKFAEQPSFPEQEEEPAEPTTPGSASSDHAGSAASDLIPHFDNHSLQVQERWADLLIDDTDYSHQELQCPQEQCTDGVWSSGGSEEILTWAAPLPTRALQSRLQPQGAAPRWAAWLPASVRQTYAGAEQMQETHMQQQAFHAGAGQMPDGNAQAASYEGAPQSMQASPVWGPIDMCQPMACVAPDGQTFQPIVMPDGMILQPVVLCAADENGADANWGDAHCYQYSGMQMQQDCEQFNGIATQGEGDFSINPLTGRVWKLSQDAKGCFQIQEAFENGTDHERIAMASELKGHVWQALKCGHANHVIQACIKTTRPASIQFIIEELTHNGTGGAAHAARHRFGCRIIERLIEHFSPEQLSPLVQELLAECTVLASHIYGYYVIQHLLTHLGPDVAACINSTLEQNLSMMAPGGYVGAVIETSLKKCFSTTPDGQLLTKTAMQIDTENPGAQPLVDALLNQAEYAATMACSRWGHNAVKYALQLADGPLLEKACANLTYYSSWLRSDRYGRLVARSIPRCQGGHVDRFWHEGTAIAVH